jgi:uncharacterized protein YjaZ
MPLQLDNLDDLDLLLSHEGLAKSAQRRLLKTTRAEIAEPLFFDLPIQVGDRIAELYAGSGSFDQANSFSATVTRYASDFTKEQVEKIIRACGENFEIRNSFEVGAVINAMRTNKNVKDGEIDEWLTDVGLKQYAKTEPAAGDG